MVPIHHKQAPKPDDRVLEAEAELLERDGHNHVGQLYFRNEADAAMWRRVEAEKIVEERARQERLKRICPQCLAIIEGSDAVSLAGRNFHPRCAAEFSAWSRGENDIRWAQVTNDTPVLFEGELVTWGSLMIQDRKMVEMQPDGSLVGGYPI